MILSTCNRVEVYGRGREPGSVELVVRFLARSRPVTPDDLEPHLYRLEGEDAVRHVFRVAASLDSMVLGEPQILGQVKEAYEAAAAAASLGSRPERAAQPIDRRREARPHRDRESGRTRSPSPSWPWSSQRRSSATCASARCSSWARAR